jgi:RNA polymerase sigma-70 factor (ECF subfamily)
MRLSTTLKEPSDAELIGRLKAGEDLALNLLMGRYKEKLYNFILRYVSDQDAAYDILQETFIRLYFKRDTFNQKYSFSTWLYQIAVNLCRDHIRKYKRLKTEDLNVDWASAGASAEEQSISNQEIFLLKGELQKLPQKLKEALLMNAIDEHSQVECARILGTTPKAIETRVHRAKKTLLNALKKQGF